MPRTDSWARPFVATGAALLTLAACSSGSAKNAATTVPAVSSTRAAGSSTSATSAGAAPHSTVHWVPCTAPAGPTGFDCATIEVPRNPAHPDGSMIGIAVDRQRATGQKIGSLLINPGGPGVSGVDYLPSGVGALSKSVRARFDIVGFDPPGIGRSAPVTCLSGPALDQYFHVDLQPLTKAGMDTLIAANRTLAAGCAAQSGPELPFTGTVDAARDMDYLRAALGDSKLNYLGFSYGTRLGEVYASLFPTHIRAMVLDGAIDPSLTPIVADDSQAAGVDSELRDFFQWCRTTTTCAWTPHTDLTSAFRALLGSVRAHPVSVHGTNRTVGSSEFFYSTAWGLYWPSGWPSLASALQAASTGDGSQLLALSDSYLGRESNGSYTNESEAFFAVNCLDSPAPTLAQIQADVPHAEAVAPFFGRGNLYGEIQCVYWPAPPDGSPAAVTAPGSPPIIVVGTTGDPATPYSWAQSVARQLQHGYLVTRVGVGHTGYSYSACVRAAVDSYLVGLTTPAPNTTCKSD